MPVMAQDVFVYRLRLAEVALAFEVLRQMVEIVQKRAADRHLAQALKGHVQLPLALQCQAHHAVRFGGFGRARGS